LTELLGGVVATLVQLIVFPVKARVHLKESLASAIVQLTRMESYIALGIDEKRNICTSPSLLKKFRTAQKKASASLADAEAFIGFTKQEPRLKGNFQNQAIVYKEVNYLTTCIPRLHS
jgi:long-subunit fatty acid transport protein